ncbi:hypothetical protein SELMODRAFT_441087 [Selaginella moellendorffii]|uniref:FCP1 homology domain-containing protein n=1 Tax=Selaginella moellendorffii TaxID=88036 RepID=D8RHS1_SELML|nr:hypothetical protein SELMODRAFT_441087 [Selaginella moellendorffii]
MNKFNAAQRNLQRDRRHKKAQEKRLRLGLQSLKLSRQSASRTPSGKRQRKLEKKLRRAQKEVLESGLVSVQDIEMICADSAPDAPAASSKGFSLKLKKQRKLKLKKNKPGREKSATKEIMDILPQYIGTSSSIPGDETPKENEDKSTASPSGIFSLIKLSGSGIVFLSTPDDTDVVSVLSRVLDDIRAPHTKPFSWCNRLTPVQATCASEEEAIFVTVLGLLRDDAGGIVSKTGRSNLKYAVGFNSRAAEDGNTGVERDGCIAAVARAMQEFEQQASVNLSNPEIVVAVELIPLVGKTTPLAGISLLPKEVVVKDLTRLKRNTKRMVWIDDQPVYPQQPELGIQVPMYMPQKSVDKIEWKECENDRTLVELIPFLTALAKLDDFSMGIAAYKQGKFDGEKFNLDESDSSMILGDDDAMEDVFEDDDKAVEEKEERLKAEEERVKAQQEREKLEAEDKLLTPDSSGPLWRYIVNFIPEDKLSRSKKLAAHEYISKKFKSDDYKCLIALLARKKHLIDDLNCLGNLSVNSRAGYYDALVQVFHGLEGPWDLEFILPVLRKVTCNYFYYGKGMQVTCFNSENLRDLCETTIPMLDTPQEIRFDEIIPMVASLNFLRDENLLGITVPDWFQPSSGSCSSWMWWPHFVTIDFERSLVKGELAQKLATTDTKGLLGKLSSTTCRIVPGKERDLCYKQDEGLQAGMDFFATPFEESKDKFLVCDKNLVLFRLQFVDGQVVNCGLWLMTDFNSEQNAREMAAKLCVDLGLKVNLELDYKHNVEKMKTSMEEITLLSSWFFGKEHDAIVNLQAPVTVRFCQ